ncbi:hypothetical protein [Leeuwenhoekiella sp. H156]|uniref:hypothetical protein n=1 Tax=Leeuwenhoekiella sp. H156 TaxID=3450128 RepID=UPI003FA47C90
MPANKKHLTRSPWQRLSKFIAGFIGGYIITQLLFIVVLKIAAPTETLISLQYGGFAVWVSLFLVSYLFKNGYKILVVYTIIIAGLLGIIYIL